jgi:hypothetical protein
MKLLPILLAVLLAASARAQAASAKHPELRSACNADSVPAHIGGKSVCLRVGLKCRARYERAYERKGFKCVSGRLQEIPPPPPPPTALAGLYRFTTSQCLAPGVACNIGSVTVLPGGLTLTNLNLPYYVDCTPPYHFFSDLSTTQDAPLTLDPGLTFGISGTFTIQIVGTNPIPNGTGNATVNGQFDTVGNVSGTFDVHVSGDDSAGTHHECDTGQLTFSGKLSSH